MNTDPITGLKEAVSTDETLRAKLLAAASYEEAAEIAARKGWAVSAAEIEQLAREFTPPDGELSDADLEHVSGGKWGTGMGSREAEAHEVLSNITQKQNDIQKDAIRNIR